MIDSYQFNLQLLFALVKLASQVVHRIWIQFSYATQEIAFNHNLDQFSLLDLAQ